MCEYLEKLPCLVDEVCKLNEELEDLDVSLNSSFDLDEIFNFEPTCCEASIVNSMGKFRLNCSKSKPFIGLKKAWYSGVQRLVPKTRDIRTYFTAKNA